MSLAACLLPSLTKEVVFLFPKFFPQAVQRHCKLQGLCLAKYGHLVFLLFGTSVQEDVQLHFFFPSPHLQNIGVSASTNSLLPQLKHLQAELHDLSEDKKGHRVVFPLSE